METQEDYKNKETLKVPIQEANLNSATNIGKTVSKKKFTILFLILVVVAFAAIAVKQFKPLVTRTETVKKTVVKQVLVKRSKDLGLVDRVLTGKAVDVNTGKIVKAARIFSPDDKTVYLELDFNSAPKGLVVDYIRYKEGRYVDHGEVVVAKEDTKNLLFNWSITKLLGAPRDGKWKVATYTNGILAKRVNYEIKSNKVSYSSVDEMISVNDPDYRLSSVTSFTP